MVPANADAKTFEICDALHPSHFHIQLAFGVTESILPHFCCYVNNNSISYRMCEFCLAPNSNNQDRDANHVDFAGFFSAAAIDAAVRQANANRQANSRHETSDGSDDEESDDDTDGT